MKARSDDGREFEFGPKLAYRGKKGCTSVYCTRLGTSCGDYCYGWHCPRCHEPCSMMGHTCEDQRPTT